ncbi:hypothetical protein BJ742DRAFT_819573 [Cladochytrium replicatum]|nr:hypothetical protein BJ742DRAFT_819573 [Cladochytrium replicatum]
MVVGFSPEEIEFLAESESIEIIPTHRMETLELIGGFYGPFRPPVRQSVPVWLAVLLKKKQKCRIYPPQWLDVTWLRDKLRDETTEKNQFSALPFHYVEIAEILLDSASDDVPQAEEIRRLIKDLRELRYNKARDGLQHLDGSYLQMDNLSLMEVNEIRPFFRTAFNKLRKIGTSDEEPLAEVEDIDQ